MTDAPPLATEARNPATRDLDLLPTAELVEVLVREQAAAAAAVLGAGPALARAVDAIALRLRAGGSLHYVGAGTSGRLANLDAAECPPTFGTPPSLVTAHLAGGDAALVRAVEGAEDDAAAGVLALNVGPNDAVAGISASGGARFVVAALEHARAAGALTVAVTGIAGSPLARAAELTIVVDTGAEPLAGSTRLRAGTAQKVVLSALSTAVMVRLGRVHDNLMVDVVATNEKLRVRAERLVRTLTGVGRRRARELLALAEGNVKVAVVVERQGVDAAEARARLQLSGGFLRPHL